jgi:hypothetical protein
MRANSHRFQKSGRNWKPASEFQWRTAYSFRRKGYAFCSTDEFLPAKQADSSSDPRLTSARHSSQRVQSGPRPAPKAPKVTTISEMHQPRSPFRTAARRDLPAPDSLRAPRSAPGLRIFSVSAQIIRQVDNQADARLKRRGINSSTGCERSRPKCRGRGRAAHGRPTQSTRQLFPVCTPGQGPFLTFSLGPKVLLGTAPCEAPASRIPAGRRVNPVGIGCPGHSGCNDTSTSNVAKRLRGKRCRPEANMRLDERAAGFIPAGSGDPSRCSE